MGREYSLTEIFAIKFVLADVVIIVALLFAGPLYAVAITALLLASVFLTWYLVQRVGTHAAGEDATATATATATAAPDPVTRLQDRYAAGELSESEFEAKLEQLIDANERADRAGVETEALSFERTN